MTEFSYIDTDFASAVSSAVTPVDKEVVPESAADHNFGVVATDELYSMIFKRRSFHTFPGGKVLSQEELRELEVFTSPIRPLTLDTKVAWKIVTFERTNCKRGEYGVLFYSEKKYHYLYSAGYMIEQLDLWLTA